MAGPAANAGERALQRQEVERQGEKQRKAREAVPVRALLESSLARFRARLRELLAVATAATSGRNLAPGQRAIEAAFETLLRENGELRAAVQVLHAHQAFQKEIVAKEKEIKAREEDILALSDTLRAVQNDVEKEIFLSAKPLLGRSTGKRALHAVDSAAVLKYAHRLSYSTSAPPGWHYSQGAAIPVPFKPAAPQEEQIRNTFLFADLDAVLQSRIRQASGAEEADAEAEEDAATGQKRKADEGEGGEQKKPKVDGQGQSGSLKGGDDDDDDDDEDEDDEEGASAGRNDDDDDDDDDGDDVDDDDDDDDGDGDLFDL